MFDVEKRSKGLGVPKDVYNKLEEEVRTEFPDDDMMFELHLLRALETYSKKMKNLI
ncbi:MAG: hypothetical protein ACLFO6_02855 [Archaeoglobaceae archaeon]